MPTKTRKARGFQDARRFVRAQTSITKYTGKKYINAIFRSVAVKPQTVHWLGRVIYRFINSRTS